MTERRRKAAPATVESDDARIVQVNLRAPAKVVRALSEWADALNARATSRGVRWDRNAVMVAALERALTDRSPDGEP